MKNIVKVSVAAVLTALIIVLSVMPAFAAGKLTINGAASAKVGDTVKFSLNPGDCDELIAAGDIVVNYDSSYLKLLDDKDEKDKKKVDFPELVNCVPNAGIENYILFNWTNPVKPIDFSKAKPLVVAEFEVVKAGKTDIGYFVSDLVAQDENVQLKKYTFSFSFDVNGKTAVKDAPAKILDIEKADSMLAESSAGTRKHFQGSFINYSDGKGDNNTDGKNHQAVTGATEAPKVIDVQKGDNQGAGGSNNTGTILLICIIAFIVLAIIVLVILRRNVSKKGK
jgi:hypothetical protein